MLVYTFDNNGFFMGTSTAQKHPLKAGFIYPKNSTIEALPNINLEAYQAFKFDSVNVIWTIEDVQEKIDDLLATTNDKGSLVYEADVNGLPVARDTTVDDAEADKTILRNTAYQNMQDDIYNELEILYLTRKAETATATSLTWDIMQAQPLEYATMGLKSEYILTGIAIGDLLDTEAKILDYATQLNAKKLTYSKYRLTRIEAYKAEVITIG